MPDPLDRRTILRNHLPLIDHIMDDLSAKSTPPIEGETLLAMLIGMSVGAREGSCLDRHIAESIAIGFQLALKDPRS